MHIELADKDGFTFEVEIEPEREGRMPWREHDGHGPVRALTGHLGSFHRVGKRPGERMLDETHAYDFAEACRIARRDCWGITPPGLKIGQEREHGPWYYEGETIGRETEFLRREDATRAAYAAHKATFPSERAYAAAAAESDFQRMHAFAQGELEFVGVIVRAKRAGIELGSASLWGIESDSGDYFEQVAQELREEALGEAKAALAELCDCKGV